MNKKFNFGLAESDDYKNLEQYILYHHKQIPAKGDVITIEKNQFKILSLTDKKIEIVEIIKN